MPKHFFDFAELAQGGERDLGATDWFAITQADVDLFADVTGDRYWLHLDEDRARPMFGGTIAHGLYILSLLPRFQSELFEIRDLKNMLNYGYDRVRFTAPVAVGTSIRMRQHLQVIDPLRDGLKITSKCQFEVKNGDRPVCVVTNILAVFPD